MTRSQLSHLNTLKKKKRRRKDETINFLNGKCSSGGSSDHSWGLESLQGSLAWPTQSNPTQGESSQTGETRHSNEFKEFLWLITWVCCNMLLVKYGGFFKGWCSSSAAWKTLNKVTWSRRMGMRSTSRTRNMQAGWRHWMCPQVVYTVSELM